MTVRTPRAGTAPALSRAPVPGLPRLHQLLLPTPFDVGSVQVYVFAEEPVTLIDTGVRSPESRAALAAGLDELGLGLEDIERVVLTHHHQDHLGQVASIRRAGADLELWVHEAEAPMIEHYSAERDENLEDNQRLFREHGVPEDLLARQAERVTGRMRRAASLCEPASVDRMLREGDRVPFKDFELEVLHAPGHTAGHLLLYEERSGTLLTGDHIMGDAVPYTVTYYLDAPPDPSDPLSRRPRFRGLVEYMRSLRSLRRQSFSTILPAHGGVITRPARAVEDALLFYEVRIQRLERGLRTLDAMGEHVTGWELWSALFPKADPVSEMRTRMLMVIGALDVLEQSGVCRTERRDDGVLVHRHA